MHNKKKRTLLLLFLIGRLGFIFFDGVFNKEKIAENIVYFKNIGVEYQETQHSAAYEQQDQNTNIEEKINKKIQSQKSYLQDIKTLEYIYNQEKSPTILKEIIKKQAQNYNFNEARKNIEKLEKSWIAVDVHLLLYVFINSNNLNITQKDSINKLLPLLDITVQNNSIWNQDYLFYVWLIEIRNRNYTKALEQRKQVKVPQYQPIITSFERTIKSYDSSKAIPTYYQDWLVALTALKNWYFTIARKIALETILQDENYILPYQVLSYAHFLTNNRDTAIEYFLKLANFDQKNKETYQFLVWTSYYRKNDFTSSILYLSQNKSTKYQTDTIRYMIINYLEIEENEKAIQYWQKLLGQNDIKNSDFFLYFYNIFYKWYFSQNTKLYQANKQLSTLFIQECEKQLWIDNDICIYWKVWSDIVNNKLSPSNEVELISLSQTYNQSYLYHILWDFKTKQWKIQEAKKRYAKTIASSQDSKEISFVENKLTTF